MTGVTLGSEKAAREAGANHAERSSRLRLPTLGAYGAGQLVQDVTQYGLVNLLLFYLTIVCGLSGGAAGLALGIALVVDAFVDPLVGSLSDNSRSPLGRRHPWMAASALPIALALVMLFSVPAGLKGFGLFAWALVALLAVRVGLSGFTIPYIALGAELTDDYSERSLVVASRMIFTVLAQLIGVFLAFGLFMKGFDGRTHRDAYPPFAITCAVVVLAAAALSTLGTLRSRSRLHAAPPAKGEPLGRLLAEVIEVFRNPSFRVLFLACLILFIGLGVATSLTLHANTYFWGLSSKSIIIVTWGYTVGMLAGVFIVGSLGKVMEKRTMALFGIGLIGLCQLVPALLKVAGIIPPAAYVPTLMASLALIGIGSGFSTIGFQSMMADAADEHEELFGARREGLYFAGISLSAKASSGVGALIAGLLLDLIGFPHGIGSAHAALAVPPEAVRNLGLLYGPGASVITGISVVTLLGYRRGRAEHAATLEALKLRRAP
jgi:GPH family glycoside/pentoside/hexuronide:cation symporter